MYIPRHMFLRNGKYYFLRRVPTRFVEGIGLNQIYKSLGTGDLKAARIKNTSFELRVNKIFLALDIGSMTIEKAKEDLYDFLGLPKLLQQADISDTPLQKSKSKKKKLFVEAVKEYQEENYIRWTQKTCKEYAGIFNRMVFFFKTNLAVSNITRNDLVKFRNWLIMPAGENGLGLQPKTANKYLTLLSSLLEYCAYNDYCNKNYAVKLYIKDERTEKEQKSAFGKQELIKLFDYIYRNKNTWSDNGIIHNFWVPLICLFSGMRVDECCQLYINDIGRELLRKYKEPGLDYTYYFDINANDDKKVKNKNSKRFIPIHSALIREGFLDYYNSVKKQNHVRLFPNLKKGPNGYSHDFVKDFSKAKKKHITDSKLITFHSLRANFATELENRNVKMSYISRLLGHKIGCITGDRYIKQQEIRLLRDAVEEVDYGLVMAAIPEPLPPPKTITEEIMGDFR